LLKKGGRPLRGTTDGEAAAQVLILALSGLVLAIIAGVVFWLWLKVTDGEIGPALVATAISMVVIIGAMMLALRLQQPPEEGRLREKGPVYASVWLEAPPVPLTVS
jgi:hypothetical protein